MDPPVLLATRSTGKLREFRPMFAAAGIRLIDLDEAALAVSPEEQEIEKYSSFEENALAKAQFFHQRSGGMPTVSDDSGLEVVALAGQPGVRSKRWSGRDDLRGVELDAANNATLLHALEGIEDRRARYVCSAAYVDRAMALVRRGETPGRILLSPRGSEGFGYDPYFESSELGLTFGEAPLEVKERVSHRGRAFRSLLAALRRSVDPAGAKA